MNDKPLIIAISKVLCKASNHDHCTYCENNTCQKIMWETFENEAIAVINYLRANGLLKRWK